MAIVIRGNRVVGWVVGVFFSSWAQAALGVVRPPPVDPGDDGTPAAPEPLLILMIIIGLLLVGGYVAYRLYKRKQQTNT